MEPVPNCVTCGAEEESIKHVLMDCTIAQHFWSETRALTGVKLPTLHHQTWARDLIDPAVCPEKDAAIILCGMWSLWMSRNKRKHGEPEIPMRQAVEWIKDTAFDLWQNSHPIKEQQTQPSRQQWQRPQPGWVKVNVDASFLAGEGRGAAGVAMRDDNGRSCGGRSLWYDHCLSVLSMEAAACRDGVKFAVERGARRLVVETDCQILVNLWEKRQTQSSEVGPILQQIEELSRQLDVFVLQFASRTCNLLAHMCTKLVSQSNPVVEWQIPPPALWDIIAKSVQVIIIYE